AQAARYRAALADLPGLTLPTVPPDREPNWQTFVVRVRERERVMAQLADAGVQTRVGVMAAHREPTWRHAAGAGALPVSDAIAADSLALPLYHDLTETDQDK